MPEDIQGRVFTFRFLIATAPFPYVKLASDFHVPHSLTCVGCRVVQLVAGPLADNIFEPLTKPGGAFDGNIFGKIVGIG